MNRIKRINILLKKHLKDFTISFEDKSYLHKGHGNFNGEDETHLSLILKPNNQCKYDRLKIHREINNILKKEFSNGLHALEIKIINQS
tara:strand:- start:2858 stop:3121 length:264 start_codon:yes stop_codon:yes gene_type:complete